MGAMIRRVLWTVCISAAALAAAGCGQPYVTAERLDRGLVLVYTGIEGRSPLNIAMCRGLIQGDVPYAVENVDWTIHVPGAYLVSLRHHERNRRKAADLAERIAKYHTKYPGRPIVLMGQSGGAAMAVWTVEALEPDVQVDGIILIAAALSPEYSLEDAARRSRRGIVSFYSEGDFVLLGIGTTLYGTMDGRHTSSAGRVGFKLPKSDEAPPWSRRVFQIAWRPEMALTGHWGGHMSSAAAAFIRDYVAPLVCAPQWDQAYIEGVAGGEGAKPDAGGVGPPVYQRY